MLSRNYILDTIMRVGSGTHKINSGVCPYWKSVIELINKAVGKVEDNLWVKVESVRTFLQIEGDELNTIIKLYNHNHFTKEWEETTFTQHVPASEVPLELRIKLKGSGMTVISTTEELILAIS